MFVVYVITLLIFGAVLSHPVHLFDLELNDAWILYKEKFNKTYVAEELSRRMIWEANLRFIQKHNLEHDLGKHTYTMGINQFADLTFEEFQSIYLPIKFDDRRNKAGNTYLPPLNADVTDENVDWRTKGFVTVVKNQGACGSCWAFSTTGSLEGQHFRKTHKLISMSEQQLIDCSVANGNNGCNGGLMSNAFNYIKSEGGIESEVVYPYQAKESPCRFNRSDVIATVVGYVAIERTEDQLAKAVFHEGPISVAIDASQSSFQFYKSGIYNEPLCSSTSLDHGVLAVGYGRDSSNHSFWIVKNSWGPQWGDQGYILMTKDQNNQCGIATLAGYPWV